MTLRLREFRAPTADGAALTALLRSAATRLVRDGLLDVVVVCRRADSRPDAIWLERGSGNAPSAPAVGPTASALLHGPPVVLDLVDAVYRYPARRCRAWMVVARGPTACRAVFDLTRAPQDREVCGLTVFRVSGEASHAVAFLLLDRNRVPGEVFAADSAWRSRDHGFEYHPLTGVWTCGRLLPRSGSAPTRSSGAFWAELGVTIMEPLRTEAAPSTAASTARDR